MNSNHVNRNNELSIAKHSLEMLNRSNQSNFHRVSQLIEYNISDLSPQTLNEHKTRLYKLAREADLNRIQIHFYGLEELKIEYEALFREHWDSNNINSVEQELYDLINTIQLQSNLSPKRYYVKVVN